MLYSLGLFVALGFVGFSVGYAILYGFLWMLVPLAYVGDLADRRIREARK